jgi:hypothetical protein
MTILQSCSSSLARRGGGGGGSEPLLLELPFVTAEEEYELKALDQRARRRYTASFWKIPDRISEGS